MIEQNTTSGIASDAAKLSFSNIISLLISLLSTMLLSRYISKFEYGTFSQINIISALAISVFTLGLPNSINYFFARATKKIEKQHFLLTYYLTITIVCLFAGVVLWAIIPFLQSYFKNNTLINYIYMLLLLPLTRVIIQSNSNMMVVISRTKSLVIYTLMYNIALLAIVFSIPLFKFTFSDYMFLYIIVQLIFSIYVYYLACKISEFTDIAEFKQILVLPKFKLIKNILLFSVPLGLGGMISTITLELNKLVIGNLMDTESLALFSIASRELPIAMLVSSFTAVLLPKMSRMLKDGQTKNVLSLWGLSIEIGYSVMLFFTLAIIVFAPQIIVFLYSTKYVEGLNVFVVCTLILVLRSTYFGIVLNVSGNTRFVLYSSLVSLGLNFILNYLFFYWFGFVGPAISTIISILLINALQLWYTSRILDVSIKQIFPWKNLLKITLDNLFIALPFIIITKLLSLNTDWKSILISIALGIIWLLTYVLLKRNFLMDRWKKLNSFTL